MSNFKKLVEARMAETGEGWQAASKHVRELVLAEEEEAAKVFVRKLKAATTQPYSEFLGPRTIEPGQTIEMVVEVTADHWPWSPTRLEFIPALRGHSLFLDSMTIGRREQMHGMGGVPLDAFLSDVVGINMAADMITVEKPLKLAIRNAGTKPQLIIGHLSGIAHAVPLESTITTVGSFDQFDIQRAMLSLESAVLLPNETKTIRIAPPREMKPPPGMSRARATYARPWSMDIVADVEYAITRIMMPSFEGGFVDVRIDGESVTGGFVEAERLGYSRSLARDFNTDRKPLEIKKSYVKDKTLIEVVVRNDSEHPHDISGIIDLTRHLSAKEIEAMQEARRNPPSPEPEKHDERFPWNIEGKKEKEAVAPGETKTFSGQPQLYFKGQELVVDPECRDDFEIVDVKVGRDPSPIFDKPISASRFHEDNKLDLKIDGAHPGIIMRLIVKNISKETRDFGATVKGIALI